MERLIGMEISTFSSVGDFCNKYISEINTEINDLRIKGNTKYKSFDGKLLGHINDSYIYSFETEAEIYIPDGTRVTIASLIDKPLATVAACGEFTMMIYSPKNLGTELSEIEISVDLCQLLNALNDRLGEISGTYRTIVRELVCNGHNAISATENIRKGSDTAVKLSKSQPITFIWGPPGTGKTHTLAYIAIEHMKAGNRVLMLSHSNVSVDGAIWRVHQIQEKLKIKQNPGAIIRYGYPRDKNLLKHEFLTSFNFAL
ncbi:MAG: hypothetical protein LBR68_03735 [Lachnoclostridium sp.]|nr:hypothetical protein [Lachnoclostridium sp.]